MTFRRLVLAQLLLASVPGAIRAQGAPQDPPAPEAIARLATDGFCCVDASGGRIEAAGRGYRATFDARGVDYVPAFGRAAGRAWPIRFELASIRRGADVVLDANDALPRAEPTVAGHTVELRRGAVVERHEARPEGLEQSFSFARPLPGRGELAVRLRVRTDLTADDPDDGTLRWRALGHPDARLGAVTMGGVVAIDARGRRTAGTLRRGRDAGGEHVELVLPAAALEGVEYPLLLDPLIGTAREALPGYDNDFPDVAYDPVSQTWCIVWMQFLGGGLTGVVGSVFRAADRTLAYAFLINQPGDEDSIRVTNVFGMGVFVLCWCNVVAQQVEIFAMALDPIAAQASQPTPIVGPGPVDTPQLSGEATPLDDDCLLVWDDDQFGICGTTLTVAPTLAITPGNLVAFGGGPDATEPTISKQGGGIGVHVVAWVDRPPGLPGWIRAQVVDHDLNLLGSSLWLHNGPQDGARPAIDGDGNLFVAVWEEQEAQHPSSTDVRGRTFLAGTAGVTSLGPVIDLAATPIDLEGAPDVARLGDDYALAWSARGLQAPFSDDVFVRVMHRNLAFVGDPLRVDLSTHGSYVHEHAPRLSSRRDGDESTMADDGVLVFADQDTVTADSDVGLQAIEAMGPGGAVLDVGGGCGPGGAASVSGPFALGNRQCRLELHGVSTLAVPFASLGVPRPLLQCGVCVLTDPVAFEFAPNTAGTASLPFALPGAASLLGAVLEFQFVTFNQGYVGCPIAPGMAASNRVRATLGN